MTVALLPEYKPSKASRHALLSGIEQSQNILSASVATPAVTWQTFRLPTNYSRAGKDIPDITGLQLCFDTTSLFAANVTLQINQFGDWVTLAEGSIQGSAALDTKEWVDIYFNEPIAVNQEWLGRQFRIGVQSDSNVWYSSPAVNNLETTAFGASGQLAYKLLCFTADDGEDFLSNRYRSMVKRSAVSNFDTVATDNANGFWYSKPNPSKYAIESLYFDVRPNATDDYAVVDRVLIDPITPGVYFNLYYSDEGDPSETERDWETKLWTPVYQTYKAERRTEHALPEPIQAKYMKVEFTHLHAQHYSPGTFSQPIRYKKHPKWVLDYFMARMQNEQMTEDPFIARNVRVVYDALKLGFDYFLDDLRQDPSAPNVVEANQSLVSFLADRTETSDQIDQTTLNRVIAEFAPFTSQPASRIKGLEYLLGDDAQGNINQNYPVESVNRARADTSQVSQLERSHLIVEANYPVMFFYVKSRHTYREVEASFENDQAYFVGVRELAFTRDHYTVATDTPMYVENMADFTNAIRNDFLPEEPTHFDSNPIP